MSVTIEHQITYIAPPIQPPGRDDPTPDRPDYEIEVPELPDPKDPARTPDP